MNVKFTDLVHNGYYKVIVNDRDIYLVYDITTNVFYGPIGSDMTGRVDLIKDGYLYFNINNKFVPLEHIDLTEDILNNTGWITQIHSIMKIDDNVQLQYFWNSKRLKKIERKDITEWDVPTITEEVTDIQSNTLYVSDLQKFLIHCGYYTKEIDNKLKAYFKLAY